VEDVTSDTNVLAKAITVDLPKNASPTARDVDDNVRPGSAVRGDGGPRVDPRIAEFRALIGRSNTAADSKSSASALRRVAASIRAEQIDASELAPLFAAIAQRPDLVRALVVRKEFVDLTALVARLTREAG
jgi:hypothetical protein